MEKYILVAESYRGTLLIGRKNNFLIKDEYSNNIFNVNILGKIDLYRFNTMEEVNFIYDKIFNDGKYKDIEIFDKYDFNLITHLDITDKQFKIINPYINSSMSKQELLIIADKYLF